MMKYAVNHPWKFRNVTLAFFTGFLQLMISYLIELTNIYIVLVNGSTQFDIISNFIIMLVIADFDNYFYASRAADPVNLIINDDQYASVCIWEVTTSYDAKAQIPENELAKENTLLSMEMHQRPKYIHMKFSDRECYNKVLFFMYKLFNLLYTSFYYYFAPFAASIGIWIFLLREVKRIEEDSF